MGLITRLWDRFDAALDRYIERVSQPDADAVDAIGAASQARLDRLEGRLRTQEGAFRRARLAKEPLPTFYWQEFLPHDGNGPDRPIEGCPHCERYRASGNGAPPDTV
jgi:hypothetical protein